MFVGTFAVASAVRPPPIARSIEEAYRIGVRSLPILLIISTFVGTNLALQGYNAFVPLGGQRLVGMFVALAGVREVCPLLAATMVAAKAGTEMAAQLAVMRTKEQIDAIVAVYSQLEPPAAASILTSMRETDETTLLLVAEQLQNTNARKFAAIMAEMQPDFAARLTYMLRMRAEPPETTAEAEARLDAAAG